MLSQQQQGEITACTLVTIRALRQLQIPSVSLYQSHVHKKPIRSHFCEKGREAGR